MNEACVPCLLLNSFAGLMVWIVLALIFSRARPSKRVAGAFIRGTKKQRGFAFLAILFFTLSYGIPVVVISAGVFGDVKPSSRVQP